MESARGECDEEFTMVNVLERILRDSHRIADATSSMTLVENLAIALQAVEAALGKVSARISKVEEEESMALTERPYRKITSSEHIAHSDLLIRPSGGCSAQTNLDFSALAENSVGRGFEGQYGWRNKAQTPK